MINTFPEKRSIAFFLCLISFFVVSAQQGNESGSSNSPYIRDVIKAYRFRELAQATTTRPLVFNLDRSLHGKSDPEKMTDLAEPAIVDQLAGVYFRYVDSLAKRPLRAEKTPAADQPPGPEMDQPGGPHAESINILSPVYSLDFADAADTEEDEVKLEIQAMLAITDTAFVRNGGLKSFRNFPKSFPHADNLIAALLAKTLRGTSLIPQSGVPALAGGFGFQEKLIVGITDWAIKTAKRQMLEAVLQKYYDILNANVVCSTMLSNTLKTFAQFAEDNSVNLAKYGALWKASFQEDLRNIPVHLQNEGFVDSFLNQFVRPGWPGKNELIPLISGGTNIVYGIYQKKHPVNLVAELSTQYLTSANSLNDQQPLFKRAVFLSHVIATSIGSFKEEAYATISLQDLRNLSASQWISFLGVIYARHKDELQLCFGFDFSQVVLELQAKPGARLYNLITTAITGYSAVQEILMKHGMKEAITEDKLITSEQLNKMLKLSNELVTSSLPYIFAQTHLDTTSIIRQILTDWQPITLAISEIGEGVSSKEYGSVMDGTLQLLNHAHKIISARSGNTSAMGDVIRYFTKYGSFMVNILSAQNSEAVETALDELIPRDQYKLKNTSTFGASLSLYPGIFVGNESIRKNNVSGGAVLNSTTSSSAASLAFYLPVGIDFSVGTGNSSWMLFLQALDFGSVLNYRLTGDDTEEESNPNITFEQLLSPGASIMHQIFNSPVVIGVGVNYTPSLRKIELSGNTYEANALRFGIFAAVDVTAFHFSLSKKKKQPK